MELLTGIGINEIILWLFLAALIAGIVDAIAGGGGLITVPSMLLAGLPPLTVLGTNRLQASIGEMTAFLTFWKHNQIQVSGLAFGVLYTAIGAIAGTYAVSLIPNNFLEVLLPIFMVLITTYSIFSKRMRNNLSTKPLVSNKTFMISAGLGIGFYNGFFGPGTGAIWMMAFMLLLGLKIKDASISTKPVNLVGNVVSLVAFMVIGSVNYKIGIVMGIGQILGSSIGSHVVIRSGDKVVRPVFIMVTLVMTAKLLYEGVVNGTLVDAPKLALAWP